MNQKQRQDDTRSTAAAQSGSHGYRHPTADGEMMFVGCLLAEAPRPAFPIPVSRNSDAYRSDGSVTLY